MIKKKTILCNTMVPEGQLGHSVKFKVTMWSILMSFESAYLTKETDIPNMNTSSCIDQTLLKAWLKFTDIYRDKHIDKQRMRSIAICL